jgi:glucose-6-phosphate isomerase
LSRVRFDYTNLMADLLGPEHGVTDSDLVVEAPHAGVALKEIQGRRDKDLRWLDLPYQTAVHDEILEYAASVKGKFKNVVVLGIGGSALGNIALHDALNGPFHNYNPPEGVARLFVLDNIDAELIAGFLETFDVSETLFNVISKSGGTAETMSQFLIFREALINKVGAENHKEHMVVTTDETNGVLREIVGREGYRSFIVPDGVGGRFSVLSPVGLLPAALVGIDIKALCAGAAEMDERCKSTDIMKNPALMHAAIQTLMHRDKDKNISVMFSYSHRLKSMADWYAQLLAESIGKRMSKEGKEICTGPTPVRAVGVTDQHSQVQLYVEGTEDKWFTFLSVDEPDQNVTIPKAFDDLEGVSYLGGRTLTELFQAERDGTRIALTESERPSATIHFDKVDAHSIGQMIFMLELSVAAMGEHYKVDAFDQPGVEAGKIAAYALMGRAGYEDRRSEIEAATSSKIREI